MNFKQYLTVKNIATAILVIAVVALIATLFGGRQGISEKKLYDKLMEAKNESINILKEDREKLMQLHDEVMESARQRLVTDSIYFQQYIANQNSYKNLNKRYNEIPDRIQKISGNNDSIRAAFRNY